MTTLVIDTGQDIVGIFSVEENKYVPYRGRDIATAIRQIGSADEVVTYNGKEGAQWSDLVELGKHAGVTGELPLKGVHTDMRSICWSDRIWGSSLINTYSKHFDIDSCPSFPDTHEGSNERDVYMTFKLWELWKQQKLKVLDGQYPASPAP
jgi:hypothetical protein